MEAKDARKAVDRALGQLSDALVSGHSEALVAYLGITPLVPKARSFPLLVDRVPEGQPNCAELTRGHLLPSVVIYFPSVFSSCMPPWRFGRRYGYGFYMERKERKEKEYRSALTR